MPGIGDLDKNRLPLQPGGQGERARITHRVQRVFYKRCPSLVQFTPKGLERRNAPDYRNVSP